MPQITLNRHHLMAALAVVVVFLAGAPGAHAGEWEWEIAPYVWMADVGVDISLNETDIVDTTIDFSDILDNAEFGALLHFEGRKGRGGMFADVVYLALNHDLTTAGRLIIPDGTRLDTDYAQFTGEAGGIYKLTGDEQGLDLLFGLRVMDVTIDLDLDFPDGSLIEDRTRSRDETLLDGFVGLRFGQGISDRWQWSIRGDVGAGESDLTWNGVLTFGVKFGKDRDKTLYLGYRHLAYEIEEANMEGIKDRDIEFTGPAVGFGFKF
jgi:hypothetical protein